MQHRQDHGGELTVIAAIIEAQVIESFLIHLGLATRVPPRSPVRRPGCCVARRDVGGAGEGDDSGPFPCPGIAGLASFMLRVNEVL